MNEVVIVVKAKNDTKMVFDTIRKDARELGGHMAEDVTVTFTEKLKRDATSASGEYGRVGDTIGETVGKRVAERIAERVKVDVNERLRGGGGNGRNGRNGNNGGTDNNRNRDSVDVDVHEHVTVDVDKKSLLAQLEGAGKEAGDKFSGAFGGILQTFFSGDVISLLVKVFGGAVLATGLASVLAAAISSAILLALGGGVIGLGVASALKDPLIGKEVDGLKKKIKGIFDGFGTNFRGPVLDFFHMFGQVLDSLKPMIDQIAASFAPIADDLAHGVIGFLQNVLPSILRGMDAAKPLIKTLSDELPGIGDAMGSFFDSISESAPAANLFFNDLLNVLPHVIKFLGFVIEAFANVYKITRSVFLNMVALAADWAVGITSAARIAFGWIPGLGPKLDRAAQKAAEFKKSVNKQLDGIHKDTSVQVKVRTVGLNTAIALRNVISQLNQMKVTAVGINAGKALNNIAMKLSGKAAGGIIGAASGGARAGLTLVGEHGPELADIPAGSTVYSNPDSMRMLSQGGNSSQPVIIQLVLDGAVLAQKMIDPQRDLVRRRFGGNVQNAYGT